MNILSHLSSGASKSFRSWKWILVIWLAVLVLVSILGLTLRGELNAIFGKSMITEKLADGTIVDVIANAGTGMRILISSFTTEFFLITFLGILVNVFFNGGLFTVLRTNEAKTGSTAFFGGAASNFWPFLVIWLLIALMIAVCGISSCWSARNNKGRIDLSRIIRYSEINFTGITAYHACLSAGGRLCQSLAGIK